MLLIKKARHGFIWPAKFVSHAAFISCRGPQDEDAGRRLTAVFARGSLDAVRSFRIDDSVDDTCWFRGYEWWLSTAVPEDG
jgi:protein-L-isoaspartate(D-aspartate) O-methyltransferase